MSKGAACAAALPDADEAVIPCRASIYPRPRPAINVLADALNCDLESARDVLVALVDGGYFIAPRMPSDHMLTAYFNAYGMQAWTPKTIIQNLGKARLRWQGMGQAGTALALSWRHVERTPAQVIEENHAPNRSQPND